MTDIACVIDAKARLGEGPCWDAGRRALWWVDIHAHEIRCFEPETGFERVFATPGPPGSLALRAAGGLIVAIGDCFWSFEPEQASFEVLSRLEESHHHTRLNDGRTDRQGRFWAGSIHEWGGQTQPLARLYRLDADHVCTTMQGGIGISNGLAWSPDGRTMYHTDSVTPFIWAWEYDPSNGEIGNRRVFVDLRDISAIADGATVDSEGCYWVALPFKGLVHRYDPDGRLARSIAMPVDAPTCCEFGSPELDILYVTTATFDRPSNALADQPLAGGLFAIDPGVKGLPSTPYAG